MIYSRLVSLLLTALFLLGSPAFAESPGGQILAPYKQGLQQALRSGMSKGTVEAIQACRIQAPEIAVSLSQNDVRVGRASHRLRNPANAPPDWVVPILGEYVANDTDRKPREVQLPDGRSGYVEPIVLQQLCTKCHGDAISSEVTDQINTLYPNDEAVGFLVGDLRGVFWAEYPTEK
jgi:Protein of unknown function (DUF3365)